MEDLGYWCLCGLQKVCLQCEYLSCEECTCTCIPGLHLHEGDLQHVPD